MVLSATDTFTKMLFLPCRMAFHCEVYARPEMPKQRGELTKKDMLAMALEMHERLKRSKGGEAEELEED